MNISLGEERTDKIKISNNLQTNKLCKSKIHLKSKKYLEQKNSIDAKSETQKIVKKLKFFEQKR